MRLLLVDDDAALRALVRATFETFDVSVEEAESVAAAQRELARTRPDVVVLDLHMPGENGLELCRRLKEDETTRDIGVILLSGADGPARSRAQAAGADAFVAKPFSPLELLATADRLAGAQPRAPLRAEHAGDEDEQLLIYARDLRHLLDVERQQRLLVQRAYRQTVSALAQALAQKDSGTQAHSHRVVAYSRALARGVDGRLASEESAEFGFLLHDIGKIGIPDRILLKRGSLTWAERRVMETHTVLGEQMLADVPLLHGEGRMIVRSHHERWDGKGYPDGLGGDEIPLGARVFAVADALDALTSHRPYRRACSWAKACSVIRGEAGRQFDPEVVEVFTDHEDELKQIRRQLAAA